MTDNHGQVDRLPIKVVLPGQAAALRPPGGGGAKVFRDVTPELRESLASQVNLARSALATALDRVGSAPMRVTLLPTAIAKSHRPTNLFKESTCPIIGVGRLGELFVKGTDAGLEALEGLFRQGASKQLQAEISRVVSVEPVSPAARLNRVSAREVLSRSPLRGRRFLTRVRLFEYGRDPDGGRLISDFEGTCREMGLTPQRGSYTTLTYAVACQNEAEIAGIAEIVGVRSIAGMPVVQVGQPRWTPGTGSLPRLPQPIEYEGDFPVVAIVDTGIDRNSPLEPWVTGRIQDVAPPYRNEDHGTFVAGLVVWGDKLNPELAPYIDNVPCKIFDLQVLPNSNPDRGPTDSLTEQELLQSLSSALSRHASDIKVWNLSLGLNQVCDEQVFSEFAEELDKLQEEHQVTFVISAGNYHVAPLLSYPRTSTQLTQGRITSPADTVLGVTVGSIAHKGPPVSAVPANAPSPFSRHGAGPNYIIKPDFVHYGGTCTSDMRQTSGIASIGPTGLTRDIGTSYSTPLVSRALAQIFHQISPAPTPTLARALLTHHARDPRNGARVPDQEENFYGFGVPALVPPSLQCSPHMVTMVFEDDIQAGQELEWRNFPYPPSLTSNGRFFGEISMTVAIQPSRSGRFGAEYCGAHVDAHFGVYKVVNHRDGSESVKFVGLVPPEHKNPGALYESVQIEQLRKWAPVRTYHGHLGDSGEAGQSWRLKLKLLTRNTSDIPHSERPQHFALVVTIADPRNQAPVYDEMALLIRNRFQVRNLAVRAAAQVATRV